MDLCFQRFEQELAGLPGRYVNILIAELEGETVGCVDLGPMGDDIASRVIELKRLFIDPGARGQSLGRALTTRAIEAAKRDGYRKLKLDTIKTVMPSAVALYRALGFVELTTAQRYRRPALVDLKLDLAAFSANYTDTH